MTPAAISSERATGRELQVDRCAEWPDRSDALGVAGFQTGWHSLVGRFSTTVIPLQVDRAIVHSWLHSGIVLPPENGIGTHPVYLYLGRQESVAPAVCGLPIRFPFCFHYNEIIVAVPDLEVHGEAAPPCRQPVTYLPRLFLSSWGSTLLGRSMYAINKSFARIDSTERDFRAVDRRGKRLLSAEFSIGPDARPILQRDSAVKNSTSFLTQPLIMGHRGKLGLARLDFDLAGVELQPVQVALDLEPGFLSWLPGIRHEWPGLNDAGAGSFQFSAEWSLGALKPVAGPQGLNEPRVVLE